VFKFWILCAFESPLWGLRGNDDVHLKLIGKRVVDFLLNFLIGVTAEALVAKIDRKSGHCKRWIITHQIFA